MKIHELKCWPNPFAALWLERKSFEVRRADREFAVGDLLLLREWDPDRRAYTGATAHRRIVYIAHPGQWGLPWDLCVLGIVAEFGPEGT